MARKLTRSGELPPRIDRDAVFRFFEDRARKADSIGPIRAVIYQDKNIDLAERRNLAEKQLLLPYLNIGKTDRVLDVGCGTGRWAEALVPHCAAYHGIDLSPGLIRVSKERLGHYSNAVFTVCALDDLSFEKIGTCEPFSRMISFGVLIYQNDDTVLLALKRMASVASTHCRMVFREPVSLDLRLTLQSHYSDEMEQYYNAIYRTEPELMDMFDGVLGGDGFRLIANGDVYRDPALNNRTQTRQRYFVFER